MMQVDIENTFNNTSQIDIFRKLWDAGGPLVSIMPFTSLIYGAHFFFLLLAWAT
jgi:hypothetical protein